MTETVGYDHGLQVVRVSVAELHTFHKNPRRGDTARIAASLKASGQYKPIVVNKGTHTGRPDEVLAGNHTLIAHRDLGWPHIDTVYVDVDEDQAARIVLADNRTSDVGTIDDAIALELLTDLDDLGGTGYDLGDVEAMHASLEAVMAGGSDDEDQKLLDESDAASWPVIRAPVPPEVYERWCSIDGGDDAARVRLVLDTLGA